MLNLNSGIVEIVLKLDSKGRLLIPADIRRRIGIKDFVKIRVYDDRILLEPIRDALDDHSDHTTLVVVKGNSDQHVPE